MKPAHRVWLGAQTPATIAAAAEGMTASRRVLQGEGHMGRQRAGTAAPAACGRVAVQLFVGTTSGEAPSVAGLPASEQGMGPCSHCCSM